MPIEAENNPSDILFGPYRLDRANARLLREGRPVALTLKAFDVLVHLASRPDRLVTKEELLSAIWPDVVVTDASVKVCVRELRKALDDDPKSPRYIETAHRRGYRFIGCSAATTTESNSERTSTFAESPSFRSTARFVGRDSELSRLASCYRSASERNRQVVFLCGAAGTGKTALIHAFIQSLKRGGVHACVGHCFEQFGASEPYLPVWEALGAIPSEQRVPALRRVMEAHAVAARTSAGAETRAHQDRLIRELAEAIEVQAEAQALVLVLEDLHWSDYSTLDLVSALARRRGQGSARLLIVGTYRPHDASAADALKSVTYDLLARQLCTEMRLSYLDERAVGEFLRARLPSIDGNGELYRALYQRTLGHPLFLVSLVDDLIEQGVLRDGPGNAAVDVEAVVPRTARAMIESQFERLNAEEQDVLQAAAVVGVEFGGAAAAGAMENADVVACEEICEALSRRGRFLESCGVVEWPDGTVASRYRFAHELYHNVVYSHIPAARCAKMHRSAGLRLEQAWRDRSDEIAAELAMHFERGREWPRAVRYLQSAADHATAQYAHREATDYLRRALDLLERLPEGERPVDELALLMSLGVHLQVTKGFAAPEVGEVHERAYALCNGIDDPRRVYPVLWGMWLFKKVRSDLVEAKEHATKLLATARTLNDEAFVLQAHQSLAVTSLCMGEPLETRTQMEQARALYDPSRHGTNTQRFGQDPFVACMAFGSIALWLTGEAAESLKVCEQSLELARRLGQPSSMALALHFSAMLHQLRGEPSETLKQARRVMELSAWEEFSFWHAGGRILAAWAQAAEGQSEHIIGELRQGIDAWLATGSRTYHTYFLGLLGDALLRQGRHAEALEALEGAIDLVPQLHEGLYEAELHRLTARCIAAAGTEDAVVSAREELDLAAAIAARQGARWVERQVALDRIALGEQRKPLAQAKRQVAKARQ